MGIRKPDDWLVARRENVAHCADGEVRPKGNPDTLPMVGASVLRRSMALRHSAVNCSELLAVRPVIEDQKADEERDGKAPGQEIKIHRSHLLGAHCMDVCLACPVKFVCVT